MSFLRELTQEFLSKADFDSTKKSFDFPLSGTLTCSSTTKTSTYYKKRSLNLSLEEAEETIHNVLSEVAMDMGARFTSRMKDNPKEWKEAAEEVDEKASGVYCWKHRFADRAKPVNLDEVNLLHVRSLDAHFSGRYREMFDTFRPCLPFFATNVMSWIRITESIIFEWYEESFEFTDIYDRLFAKEKRRFQPTHKRQLNETRPRDPEMNPAFAEYASYIAYTMAKQQGKEDLTVTATVLYSYVMLKRKKYHEATAAIRWLFLDFADREVENQDENPKMALLLAYKAEIVFQNGKYNRCIEYCLRILRSSVDNERLRTRALMLIAMAYMRKLNYERAWQYIQTLINEHRLDNQMLENVALLGLSLSHRLSKPDMVAIFVDILRDIAH